MQREKERELEMQLEKGDPKYRISRIVKSVGGSEGGGQTWSAQPTLDRDREEVKFGC